jgi:hypothetical protein
MSIPLADVPEYAARAALRLRDDVRAIAGDGLVAAWLYGGTTFADRPRRRGDLDICVVFADATPEERRPSTWRADPTSRPSQLLAAQERIATELGVTFDVLHLLATEIGGGDLPARAFWADHRVNDWAVCRAHWLAGQYVLLDGRRPDELLVAPTRGELNRDLDRELEHLERHVFEGDADDPYEATYAMWNGCRILYTVETGSPVISKRSAGAWGLEHLHPEWHDAIRAANRNYDGDASATDVEVLRDTMAPFVAMVRTQVPITEPRPPGPPRWS